MDDLQLIDRAYGMGQLSMFEWFDFKDRYTMPEKLTDILNQAAKRLDLSARAYHRVIKLARTIADLEGSENVSESHLFEALQYRPQ